MINSFSKQCPNDGRSQKNHRSHNAEDLNCEPELDGNLLNALAGLDSLNDTSFLRELIDLYVNEACDRIKAIKLAVNAGDGEGLKRQAHALKGSSATLGLTQIAHICEGLERLTHADCDNRADALVQLLQYKFNRAQRQFSRSFQTNGD